MSDGDVIVADVEAGASVALSEVGADNGLGQLSINPNVYAIIAHETAKEVPGVVELSGSLVDGIAGMIGKKPKDKGISVEEEQDLLRVNLTVVLEYGINIPEICQQLQKAVKDAIEAMTGKQVFEVNVAVQGVRNTAEKNAEV